MPLPPPPSDSVPDALMVVETLQDAASENKLSSLRRGQTVHLPADLDDGQVFMTGDLHDHRSNFTKLVRVANLRQNPNRHLIIHEVIHGEHFDANGAEDSWISLVRAAELKLDFPNQVHFLLANHDLAQIHGEGISKGGAGVCEAFNKGIKRDFPNDRGPVQAALTEFLLSFPLAVRCADHLFFSHSLPSDPEIEAFDYTVFDRDELTGPDYAKKVGPVYQLIWGRRTGADGVNTFLERVGAKALVTGHQPQEEGFLKSTERHIILASDHNQGAFLPLRLGRNYTADEMVARIRKFIEIDTDLDD